MLLLVRGAVGYASHTLGSTFSILGCAYGEFVVRHGIPRCTPRGRRRRLCWRGSWLAGVVANPWLVEALRLDLTQERR